MYKRYVYEAQNGITAKVVIKPLTEDITEILLDHIAGKRFSPVALDKLLQVYLPYINQLNGFKAGGLWIPTILKEDRMLLEVNNKDAGKWIRKAKKVIRSS